jgi:phage tail P2-like protein
MINLYDGQLTDLLQNCAGYNAEIQALSYALLQEKRRIMELAQQTRTLSMIDQLPEAILDVLAVELRTPYYTMDMTIDQKREIIKNTLVWYYHAGTPSAVEELVASIFGQGQVVEWFDFTEEPFTPGTFDIVTDTRLTEDIVYRFLQIISQVKNTRSHVRRVLVERHQTMTENIGVASVTAPETNVLNSIQLDGSIHGQTVGAAGATSAPKETIMNHAPARSRTGAGINRVGAVLTIEDVHLTITNGTPPSTEQIGQTQRIASVAVANSHITTS